MSHSAALVLVVIAGVLTQAAPLSGQQPAGVAAGAASAERLFETRCASCHGDEPGFAPTRATLSLRPAGAIVAALTTGAMRPMAEGLTPQEIGALASYLSAAASVPDSSPVTAQRGFCSDVPRPLELGATDWNGWGRDAASSRFHPDPGIAAADVPRLRVKWAFALDGGIHSQPTVVGDRVFVSSVPGRLYSLDAATGCIHWSYQTAPGTGDYWGGAGSRSTVVIGPLPQSLGPGRYAAYLGDDLGFVHAVDAATGELLWRTRIDDHPIARLTGSAVLHDGRLYVPVSSLEEASAGSADYECCTFRGSIVALDAFTGEIVWKRYTIDEEPQPYRVSRDGVRMIGPAGAPIWSTPTLDARRGVLYAATGNSYTELSQAGSNSIIAFALETGEVRWRKQIREADNFVIGCPNGANCPENTGPDFDFGSSPILRALPDGRELLIVGDKGGVVYGIDPDDQGRLIWSTRVGNGSSLGGVQWGPAADEEHVYVAISDYTGPPGARRPGLNALRIATGDVLWHTPAPAPTCSWGEDVRCSPSQSAAVTLMPGVVFSGSLDGNIRAYSTRDGSVVWTFDTARLYDAVNGLRAEGGSLDGAGPTIANGTLFVTSGYARFGRRPGNVLLAFTVGGR